MSELSDIYSQFETSLIEARERYDESIEAWSEVLLDSHNDYLEDYFVSFGEEFDSQVGRRRIKRLAESFFGREELTFVAVDGSCHKEDHEGFISFYGGAYGSRGEIAFEADTARIDYRRWEFDRDVSMVAFLPVPPDQLNRVVTDESDGHIQQLTDAEIRELGAIHTKLMELAEVYLAYTQAQSGMDYPRLLLMDKSLSGLLGNTSYRPDNVELTEGRFEGEQLSIFDLRVGLAHPFNEELTVPSVNGFRPWNHVLQVAHQMDATVVEKEDTRLDESDFSEAKHQLEEVWDYMALETPRSDRIELNHNPKSSWRKLRNVFGSICESLFRDKNPSALFYGEEGDLNFMKPADITFLTGVGLRSLIERAWERPILLVGVAKDSSSRYFYRNFLGSLAAEGQLSGDYRDDLTLPDRRIVEILSNIVPGDVSDPWGTIEFDSSFLTLHPEEDQTGEQSIQTFFMGAAGPVMRPERLFMRSIPVFLLDREENLSSHAIFVDRLCYPGWDDEDSGDWEFDVDRVGTVSPFYFSAEEGPPRLQRMSQYFLSILVRNHFPEALGYPDPLHKADWGAKSMKRQVRRIMESGETPIKANPLERSMRDIREQFGR